MKIFWKIVTGTNGGRQRQISSGRNPIKAFDQSKPNSPERRMPSGVVLPFPRPHNYSTRSLSTQRYVQPALVSLNFSLVPSFVTPALLTCLQSGCLAWARVYGICFRPCEFPAWIHSRRRLTLISRGKQIWGWVSRYWWENNMDSIMQNLIQNSNNYLFMDLKEETIILYYFCFDLESCWWVSKLIWIFDLIFSCVLIFEILKSILLKLWFF